MKRMIHLLLLAVLFVSGCGLFIEQTQINVISREVGSGTRSAFVEVLGIEDDNGDDATTVRAVVQNSTNGVMQLVNGDQAAIGYISYGSLNDNVQAVRIDGVEINPETMSNGEYALSRPFNLAWKKDGMSDLATDFLAYMHSEAGQQIVESLGFVRVNKAGEGINYQPTDLSGTIEVVGSTSVTPVVEKLAEAYRQLNPNVKINITSNGSSAGMEAAMNGVADFGMASRALNEKEKAVLESDAVALDGIAIIVNNKNTANSFTTEELQAIFKGELTDWKEFKQ